MFYHEQVIIVHLIPSPNKYNQERGNFCLDVDYLDLVKTGCDADAKTSGKENQVDRKADAKTKQTEKRHEQRNDLNRERMQTEKGCKQKRIYPDNEVVR